MNKQPKLKIALLGSTGSIGESTFRVLQAHPDRFEVTVLVARKQVDRLAEQAVQLNAKYAITTDLTRLDALQSKLCNSSCQVACGEEKILELVASDEVDIVLCAIVGTGGLQPVLTALDANKTIALASKEVLVMAGSAVMSRIRANKGKIIPVDSEHSAIFQCLAGRSMEEVESLILTASGGALRDATDEEIRNATWEKALAHPTWKMGPKITIDSASLMNKALELVEAGFLFNAGPEKLKVAIHPQSIVHSMVAFVDGSILAQMAQPDMRLAIQYALSYPARLDGNLPRLSLKDLCHLEFREPDRKRFPSLDFAYAALQAGGTMPAVMNAANEVAVEQFRLGKISFPGIWQVVEETMQAHKTMPGEVLPEILEADAWARSFAANITIKKS